MRPPITAVSSPEPPASMTPRRLSCAASCASTSPPLPGWRSPHRMLPASSSGSELTARSALRELATPHLVDEEHVLFGYVFQCFTARRDA